MPNDNKFCPTFFVEISDANKENITNNIKTLLKIFILLNLKFTVVNICITHNFIIYFYNEFFCAR